MCRYRVQFHFYHRCKLIDLEPDRNDEPGQDQAPAEDVPQPEPVREPGAGPSAPPSRFLNMGIGSLFASRGGRTNGGPVEMPERQAQREPQAEQEPQAEPVVEGPKQPHIIKETFILQCAEAQANNDLAGAQDKRHCPGLTPMSGYDPDQEPDELRTPANTPCPVCEAIERATNEALDTKLVEPWRGPTTEEAAPANPQVQDNGNLGPPRGNQGRRPDEEATTTMGGKGESQESLENRGPSLGIRGEDGDMMMNVDIAGSMRR
ncbi:uncharacterized protein PG986_011354 [Apiospora aurea]|uniref:Uncharacterized protein n=1 Tax=Apiospora aurea TaxID=335848 RepID=A0ABR1Q657_9PEZI